MTEREEVFRKIQAALAGHSETAVLSALISGLVVAVGVSAKSLTHAESVINALPAEMMPLLRAEWAKFRRHRTVADLAADIESVERGPKPAPRQT